MIIISLFGIYLFTSLLFGFALARIAADSDRRLERMRSTLYREPQVLETATGETSSGVTMELSTPVPSGFQDA